MSAWTSIVAAGVVVYGLRSSLLLGQRRLPAAVERMLAYVGPATLAALVAPALLAGGGTLADVGARAAALAAGTVVAHRSGSIGATVASGMAVLWAVTAAGNWLS